jgi:hypothetical protein
LSEHAERIGRAVGVLRAARERPLPEESFQMIRGVMGELLDDAKRLDELASFWRARAR